MTITYTLLILLAFAVSALCGYILIPLIVDFCHNHRLYDLPDGRKVHHNNIPRLGGTCFMPCMFVAAMLSVGAYRLSDGGNVTVSLWSVMFAASLLMVYCVGVVDDVVGVRPVVKLLVQVGAACLLPFSGLYINTLYGFLGIDLMPFWVGAPLTMLAIAYIINAVNLIDGIDGLAGGLVLIALMGFLYCFHARQLLVYSVFISGLAGVVAVYLYYNLTGGRNGRCKIFMGDSGSLTLGFMLAFLFVKLAMYNQYTPVYDPSNLLFGYTLLIVPCFDVVRVVLSRLRSGQPLFKADKRHIHHKLLGCGLSQHWALAVILSLQLLYVAVNWLLAGHMSMASIVVADICIYTIFNLAINAVAARRRKG